MKNRNNFQCRVRNKTNSSAELIIYGDIVSDSGSKWSRDDVCPMDVVEALDECKDVEQLDIHINSCGGSVFAGNAIYNRIKAHKGHKTVHIDSLAASIASVIAMAGDEIRMPENAYMMIHKAWDICWGNADELRAYADRLELIELSIINAYSENAAEGFSKENIAEKMRAETWLTAADAAEMFPKVIVEAADEAAACMTELQFMNAPEGAKAMISGFTDADRHGKSDKNAGKGVENSLNALESIIKIERSTQSE